MDLFMGSQQMITTDDAMGVKIVEKIGVGAYGWVSAVLRHFLNFIKS